MWGRRNKKGAAICSMWMVDDGRFVSPGGAAVGGAVEREISRGE